MTSSLVQILRPLRDAVWRVTDPRRIGENYGQRVVFADAKRRGYFKDLRGRRILEIGPKHGLDSKLLAELRPRELVIIDLPEKGSLVKKWLPGVEKICPVTYIENNLLFLRSEQLQQMGTFDLVWCLGVLYHNVEQLRLVKRLYDLTAVNGRVVIESLTTRNRILEDLNVVDIHWPTPYRNVQTLTHLPSRKAIKSWLEMAGFQHTKILDVYSRAIGWQRAVVTGQRTLESKPYESYAATGLNPPYIAGDSH